jgi:hypothetical protein
MNKLLLNIVLLSFITIMFLSCSTTKKQYSSQIYFTLDNYGVFQPIKLDESMLVYDKNTVSEYIAGADIVSKCQRRFNFSAFIRRNFSGFGRLFEANGSDFKAILHPVGLSLQAQCV